MSDMGALAFIALLAELAQEQQQPQPGPPGPPGPPAPYVDPIAPPPPGPFPPPPPPPDAPQPDVFVPVDPGGDPVVQPQDMPHGDAAPRRMPPAGDRPNVPRAPVTPPGGGPIPPMPPWPSPPIPRGLPPFPGPGWEPDIPVTPAIASRAAYWNALLWNYPTRSIRKPYVQEQLGGQWVTFAAAWHPGDRGAQTYMATEAWRLRGAPPVAPPMPAPAPSPTPAPAGTPLEQAAQNMNAALAAGGYRQSDQGLYRAFQALAFPGSKPDGFPGTHTMGALHDVLAGQGIAIASVPVYPWKNKPGMSGYDGTNAPTLAEWNR